MYHRARWAYLAALSLVGVFAPLGELRGGQFQGRVFNLNGTLLNDEPITVRAVNVNGTITATAVSNRSGEFTVIVSDGQVPNADQSVVLTFQRGRVVTRTVVGLLGRSDRTQVVDVTVPREQEMFCKVTCCTSEYDRAAALPASASPATLVVSLPANGRLTINDAGTVSKGERRVFVSPPLEQGFDYYYTLKAEFPSNGAVLSTIRRVSVRAGEQASVTFHMDDTAMKEK
jgi:uncharacterized protein (TIGR03000 family)